MYTGAMFGRAVMRLGTTTGARIGEIGQIAADPKCIIQVEMPSGKKASAFLAKPKGLTAPRTFYMDDVALECVLDIVRRHRELDAAGFGGLAVTKPPPHFENKCGPAKYVFQIGGKALENSDMNACLRFMLHGLDFRDAEGKTYSVSSHFLRHAFATEMRKQGVEVDVLAELLNQKWVEVTKYYARPTPKTVREAAEKSFVTHLAFTATDHVRQPNEIVRMIEDADGKVGALTNVLGGTCTERGFCPAKFQCIGCAANAPDPGQRAAVEMKRRHAMEWLKISKEQNLTSEIAVTKKIIRSCDDMLAEMALLITASENAQQVASIVSHKRFGANR